MYYRNRWYDSNLGRFISEDPIRLAGGINQFGYVGGNPVGFTDPSGLERYSLEQYRGDWNREKSVQPIDIDLDRIQIVLGLAGMIPGFGEPFDLIDGTICLVNGDYVGASLSATSAIPLFGTAAGIVNVTNRVEKLAALHRNSNKAIGNNAIYKIEIDGEIHKFGKVDIDRVTQSSGQPTRLHQQIRKLREELPDSNIEGTIFLKLQNSTTREIVEIETLILQNYFGQTGIIPVGNQRSFKPKRK